MWHSNLEVFWDGSDHLAIGFDGSIEDDSRSGAAAIGVFAAADEGSQQSLIGVIEGTSGRMPWFLFRLPPSYRFVRLRRAGDVEGTNEVTLLLSAVPIRGGEWRLAFAAAPSTTAPVFQFSSRPPVGTENELVSWALSRIEGAMLWGVVQRRLVQRKGYSARIQIGAARLFWPLENRIEIEDVSRPAEVDVGSGRQDQDAPAIYSKLRTDEPPAVRLRLFLGSAGRSDEAFLRRLVLVHVMHQRRHLDQMNQWRDDHQNAVVEPLTIDRMIRFVPKGYQDHHAAIATKGSIAAINLATALSDPVQADHDGFELIAVPDADACIDVNFYGAVLGDDVGLASNNAATDGDIFVRGGDPGGYAGARFFRVTATGLEVHGVDESEAGVAEAMREVAKHEDWSRAQMSPMHGSAEHWSLFCRRLQLPRTGEPIDHALGESIGLFVLAAWANASASLVDDGHSGETDFIRSLERFREASAIISAIAPRRALAVDANAIERNRRDGFTRSFAAYIGNADLVASDLDAAAEFEAWQILTKPGVARQLLNARVCLSGTAADIRNKWNFVISHLHDEMSVEEIAESYTEKPYKQRPTPDPSQALSAYLTRRRSGNDWTDLAEAEILARYCRDIQSEWERIRKVVRLPGAAPSQARPRDTRDLNTLLADVVRLLDSGRRLAKVQHEVERIAGEFQKLQSAGVLDRNILRVFEDKLSELVGSNLDDQLAEQIIASIETWAKLPNFLENVAPRTRRGNKSDTVRKREVLTDYVNRVWRSVPHAGQDSGFDRLRHELTTRVRAKVTSEGPVSVERKSLADDLSQYADILLHHAAYCRILDQIDQVGRSATPPRSIREVKLRLTSWPHQAADTWDRAMSLAGVAVEKDGAARSQALVLPDL